MVLGGAAVQSVAAVLGGPVVLGIAAVLGVVAVLGVAATCFLCGDMSDTRSTQQMTFEIQCMHV